MKLTIEEFIKRSNNIHNNKFDYQLVNYVNVNTKVKIICPIHGIFEKTPSHHINNQGCPNCTNEHLRLINLMNVDEFLIKAINIHGKKYDYSKVNYVDSKTKIKILCSKHGIFNQTPNSHLNGNGCAKCAGVNKLTTEQFIEKAKKIHSNKYDYSKVNYFGAHKKVIIICKIHGEFKQIPSDHTRNKSGCSRCNESHGERNIINFLEKNKIDYIRQKRFKECRYKNPLPFDFYLPNNNILIEYDGEQHFFSFSCFGGDVKFNKQKINEEIKNNFAKNNNIKLIRIKYDENIENKLKEGLINIDLISSYLY